MKPLILVGMMIGLTLTSCSNQNQNQQQTQEQQTQQPMPEQKNTTAIGKDLVCGMDVSDSTYAAEYEGKKYFFCAEHCKEEFLKDPSKYISKK